MADDGAISTTSPATGGTGAFNHTRPASPANMITPTPKLQLPNFTPNATMTWFQRAEVNFRLAKVADESIRADMVLAMLDAGAFEKISPWLSRQPGTLQYTDLKKHLLEIYSMPATVRAQKALDLMMTPLGDTRPSDSWREIEKLIMLDEKDADGNPREISLSKEIFLRRLPRGVRAQLEDAEKMNMKDLVCRADNLFLASQAARFAATQSINEVQEAPPPRTDEHEEEDVAEVNAVYTRRPFEQRQQPHRQRFPQRRDGQPHLPARKHHQPAQPHRQPAMTRQENPNWCCYHRRFGSAAFSCRRPCSFPKN